QRCRGFLCELVRSCFSVGGVVRSPARSALFPYTTLFRSVTGAHAADYRRVVGAVDGDGDDPAGGAIARDRGEAVGERLAGTELLDRRLAVLSPIGPPTAGRDLYVAEAIAAGCAGLPRDIR